MKISSLLFPAVVAFLLSSTVVTGNGAVRGAAYRLHQAADEIVPDDYIAFS
jgi:hypothetical protein